MPSSKVNPTTTTRTSPTSTKEPADKEATTLMIPDVEGGGKTDPHFSGGGSNAGLIGGVIVGVILLILAVVIITVLMIRYGKYLLLFNILLYMKEKSEKIKNLNEIII